MVYRCRMKVRKTVSLSLGKILMKISDLECLYTVYRVHLVMLEISAAMQTMYKLSNK